MDPTFIKMSKKNPLSRKGKKKARSVPEKPEGPPDLEAVVDSEIGTIRKAPVRPRETPMPVASAPLASAALASAALASAPRDSEAEDLEESRETGVLASDVLAATRQLEPAEKKRKSRRGGGGDFGAAYKELFTQLSMRMLNRIYRYFQRLYIKSESVRDFKERLAGIQKWNQGEINRRAKEIVEAYPDTEQYFKYAYAANVMLMSVVVQKDEDSEDVEIEVPKFSSFIQKSYVESARALYDNAGVLDPDLPDHDRLRIREELFRCFGNAIATALRMMVPLDAIAPKMESTEKFDVDGDDSDEADEDDEDLDESEEEEEEEDSEEEDEDSEEEDSEEEEEEDEDSEEEEESEEESEEEEEVPRKRKLGISKKALQTPDKSGLSYY